MADNSPCLFLPQNLGPYEVDLRNLFTFLQQTENTEGQLSLIENSLHALPFYLNARENFLRYRASLMVLADLLRQQWQSDFRQGSLYLLPPNWAVKTKSETEAQERKNAIRRSLLWEREAQFSQQSVREFIKYMERERPFGGHLVSIRSLIADGETLSRQLQGIIENEDKAEQLKQVWNVIQPYLQHITSGARCSLTGLYLQDIWRYFRYTWATPYKPTPGRQMFYLIRDAAQPFHPVIGIAALGSSMVQLTVRDNVIGWTPQSILERINSPDFDDDHAFLFTGVLRQTLQDALNDLAVDDLVAPEELVKPTQETLQKLEDIEKKSKDERLILLQQQRKVAQAPSPPNQLSLISLSNDLSQLSSGDHSLISRAQGALFRTKRAKVLRQLLQAKWNLEKAAQSIENAEGLRAFWQTSGGQQAIKTLVRENKKRRIGINLMDIIVCGSIPPYNTLLGGKLVAMLLASPQIMHDYQKKYASYASTIASKMKGEEVRRDSRLVFLGTTSLYAGGSSQYNRIAIPIKDRPGEYMRYIRYGLTEGFGSVHFSGETVNALDELQEFIQGARLINNRFGEGVNPKMRRVRNGLAAIGLTPVDDFLRHRSQRIVYGLLLGRKSLEFLRGETLDPEYYFDTKSEAERQEATEYICHYWATRWLMSRIQSRRFLDEVSEFRPGDSLLSGEIGHSPDYIPQEAMEL